MSSGWGSFASKLGSLVSAQTVRDEGFEYFGERRKKKKGKKKREKKKVRS